MCGNNEESGYCKTDRFAFENPGDTLVVDNWRMLHARSAVPMTQRSRKIHRAYLSKPHMKPTTATTAKAPPHLVKRCVALQSPTLRGRNARSRPKRLEVCLLVKPHSNMARSRARQYQSSVARRTQGLEQLIFCSWARAQSQEVCAHLIGMSEAIPRLQ